MTPMPALADKPNRTVGDAELVCQKLTGFSVGKPPFDFANLIFSQLGLVVSYALQATSALCAVVNVALACVPTKVMLVDAWGIVAGVAGHVFRGWRLSIGTPTNFAVCRRSLPVNSYLPVARLASGKGPLNAFIRRCVGQGSNNHILANATNRDNRRTIKVGSFALKSRIMIGAQSSSAARCAAIINGANIAGPFSKPANWGTVKRIAVMSPPPVMPVAKAARFDVRSAAVNCAGIAHYLPQMSGVQHTIRGA